MAYGRRFRDRAHAGRELAGLLTGYAPYKPLVVGLPRGGVPVAFEVARELRSPLDIVPARKIGAPFHPEYGIGAVAPGNVLILDGDAIRSMGIRPHELERIVRREIEEMNRRSEDYQSGDWGNDAASSVVIVVDDGLATGVTAKAALESARITYQPERLVFASPVSAEHSAEMLEAYADEVVSVERPKNFIAVSFWYDRFPQTSDAEVVTLLEEARSMEERDVTVYA